MPIKLTLRQLAKLLNITPVELRDKIQAVPSTDTLWIQVQIDFLLEDIESREGINPSFISDDPNQDVSCVAYLDDGGAMKQLDIF